MARFSGASSKIYLSADGDKWFIMHECIDDLKKN